VKSRVKKILSSLSLDKEEWPGIRFMLIIGMLILLLVVIFRFGAGMYKSYEQGIQSEIEVRLSDYDRMSRLIADERKYIDEHSALLLFEKEYIDSRLILAAMPSLAEARFQNMINDLAASAGLNVQSLRVMPRTSLGEVSGLTIGINCRGEIRSIKKFLEEILNHDKLIFVDQMELRIISKTEKRDFNFNAKLIAWTRS